MENVFLSFEEKLDSGHYYSLPEEEQKGSFKKDLLRSLGLTNSNGKVLSPYDHDRTDIAFDVAWKICQNNNQGFNMVVHIFKQLIPLI